MTNTNFEQLSKEQASFLARRQRPLTLDASAAWALQLRVVPSPLESRRSSGSVRLSPLGRFLG